MIRKKKHSPKHPSVFLGPVSRSRFAPGSPLPTKLVLFQSPRAAATSVSPNDAMKLKLIIAKPKGKTSKQGLMYLFMRFAYYISIYAVYASSFMPYTILFPSLCERGSQRPRAQGHEDVEPSRGVKGECNV